MSTGNRWRKQKRKDQKLLQLYSLSKTDLFPYQIICCDRISIRITGYNNVTKPAHQNSNISVLKQTFKSCNGEYPLRLIEMRSNPSCQEISCIVVRRIFMKQASAEYIGVNDLVLQTGRLRREANLTKEVGVR